MACSRREFLRWLSVGSVGFYIAGCTQDKQVLNGRPGPDWPEVANRPTPQNYGSPVTPTSPSTGRMNPVARSNYPTTQVEPPDAPGSSPASTFNPDTTPIAVGSLKPIPRASWAKGKVNINRIQAMAGVSMITVHHEGWTPVTFSDAVNTAARLDSIRKSHIERMGAGDIGYHYIIDRAGRLWQGRDVRYQGAHVREHNPHNLGIMCLGNFDEQRPTDAQYATLRKTLASLMKQYKVPVKYVYTHQELNKTECPGSVLQSHMRTLRRGGIV